MITVLIVDDSETQRTTLNKDLSKAGFKIIEATSGRDALNKLAATKDIHVIITDLNMPEMDGITMCMNLKKANTHPNIPIFILSSEATSELKKRSKEAGVTAWIVKPHVPEKLVGAIKKVAKAS